VLEGLERFIRRAARDPAI